MIWDLLAWSFLALVFIGSIFMWADLFDSLLIPIGIYAGLALLVLAAMRIA